MEQQDSSTPTGVSASDPAPDQIIQESENPLIPAPEVARRIEDGVEANIPGGWAVQQESTIHSKPRCRREDVVSDPDRG